MRKKREHKGVGTRPRSSWLCLLAALVVALVGWLAVPEEARADWFIAGEELSREQVIEDDVLATGTDVVIDGTIDGDLVAIGSTVTVNGPVSGSLLAVGQTVTLNGEVGGSTYVAGRTLKLGESASVVQDVHFAGLLLDGRPGSRVERDLGVATLRAKISSQIGRSLSGFILLMTFDGQIGGGTDQAGSGEQSLRGLLPGPGGTLLGIALGAGVGQGPGYAAPSFRIVPTGLAAGGLVQQQEGESGEPPAGIPEGLLARLSDLAVLLLLGGLAIWLRPALVHRPAEWLRRKPLPAAGFGLLAVVLAANAVAIAILLAALLLVTGIWLGTVTLWTLAFILWGIGYPAVVLGLALVALTVLYGSKVIVADMVGTLILKRVSPGAMEYRILPLLLGLVLYVVLRAIPILGWVIEVVVTIFGLGAIWVAYRHRRPALPAAGVDEPEQPVPGLEF